MKTKLIVITGLMVALGIGQITAQKAPNNFDATRVFPQILQPPLNGAVGVKETDATKVYTQILQSPLSGAVGVRESQLPEILLPPKETFQAGQTTTWTTIGNVHVFGAATIFECPGMSTPDSGQCASVRSPADISDCSQGPWTWTFRRIFVDVPCGGPYGTMVLTYWRAPYVGFGEAVQFAALVDSNPSGGCTNGYRSQITALSHCPSPTPTPSPSPTPTSTPTPNPTPTPTATPTSTPDPSPTPTPTPTPVLVCVPPTWICPCTDNGHGYIPDPICCQPGQAGQQTMCGTCWDPIGQLQYCCCCYYDPVFGWGCF